MAFKARAAGGAVSAERARRLALIVASAATSAVVLLSFGRLSLKSIAFPYPLDYGEGAILDAALRLSRFTNIYPADLSTPPWFVSNYPPLYYLAHVPFVWLAGPALWYGRLLSQISAVVAALSIGVVVTGLTVDAAAGVLAGLTFLAIPIVAAWAQYDRVDMLAFALTWIGLWLGLRGKRIGLSAACFVAASFTRQTAAIPALVAACVWLHVSGRTEAARRLVITVGIAGATILLALDVITRGGFVLHVITGTVGHMRWDQLVQLQRVLVTLVPWLLATLAAVVVLGAWARLPGWPFIAAYGAAAAVASLAVAHDGSYINYFLDLCAAASLAVGMSVAWLRPRPLLATAALAMVCLQAFEMARPNVLSTHLLARLNRSAEYAHLTSLVVSQAGPVLADEPMALLPLNRRTIDFQPFAMTQLARAGLWNPSSFVEGLAEGKYPLLLLRMPRQQPVVISTLWDASMAAAIEQSYEASERVPVDDGAFVAVMRPKSRLMPE